MPARPKTAPEHPSGSVVNVNVDCGCHARWKAYFTASEARIMSAISDVVKVLQDAYTAMQTRVSEDTAELNRRLDELSAKFAEGTMTEDQIKAVREIADGMGGIDPLPGFPVAPTDGGTDTDTGTPPGSPDAGTVAPEAPPEPPPIVPA